MDHSDCIARREFLSVALAAPLLGAAGCALQPKQKGEWQIGCFTRPWAAYDLVIAMDAIAEAGFRYMGLMTSAPNGRLLITLQTSVENAARIGEQARARGLGILSAYGGDFPVQESVQAGVNGLKQLIDLCVACGSQSLLLGGAGREDLFDDYFKVVAECCDYAAEQKVRLVLKPHGGLNATGAQCRQTIEKVNHPVFRLWYDPGNIFYYSDGKLDPTTDVMDVGNVVCGMCVKDFLPPKNVEVTPGTGQVNFPVVLQRLRQAGLTGGPLVVECLKKGDLAQLAKEAKQARVYLQQIVAA